MQKLTLKLLFLGMAVMLCNSAFAVAIPKPIHTDEEQKTRPAPTNPQPPVQQPVAPK